MRVRELDDATVRKIAAGEVIERPASAVKELVENSLDADASRIDVAVEAGGTERIRVADDGVGMSREEARLAVREHTTSKIGDADDLESVSSLGFRGEALYAIGAVSEMTLTTRPRGGERATEVRVEFGDVVDVAPAGRPEGTTVDVRELFAETPARRKFLKTEATEFDHVNRIVSRYALANPGVAVSLSHGGREVFSTPGRDDLEAALLAVYGREVAESMLPVDGDGVEGYVSHPETTRSTREYVSTFVNGRYVPAGALREAVVEAYGGQLAPDRYPFAVLFVDVAPDAVDANVHPRKMEVRFGDEAAVRGRVRSAVEEGLLEHGLLRSGAPRGRSAPDETEIAPEGRPADGERDAGDPSEAASSRASSDAGRGDRAAGGAGGRREGGGRSAPRSGGTGRFRTGGEQAGLGSGTADREPDLDRLPAMRVLGQFRDTYVVAETDGGLVLIDQHAADERVNYERLRSRLADAPATQALADPVALELTAREAALFEEHAGALAEAGFRAERTGERTVEVRAVPAVFDDALDPALLRDALGEFVSGGASEAVESRTDALLADLACHPSITGHTPLTEGSIRELLEALDGCENPYACPHGRPVIVEIDEDELADRFERDYPGHGGRRGEPDR